MPQMYPSQWLILINLSCLTFFLFLTVFNFVLESKTVGKNKTKQFKFWKW